MSLRRPPTHAVSPMTSIDESEPTHKKASNIVNRQEWRRAPKLLLFDEIPVWQQDNEFILSGYRPTSGSIWVSLASLLYINNQTINTYSHLVGCVIFIFLPFYFYECAYKYEKNAQPVDLLVISIYTTGVAVCFAFSSTFHIMWNHSHSLTSLCNKLDYIGILVLMWGAGIPTIYYGFICDPHIRSVYCTTTTATALCCAILTLDPHFAKRRFRHWRACFYAGFGLSSIIFVVHGLLIYGWDLQKSRMSLVWMGWMATSNLIGAALYAMRVPERWYPYRFDIYGASHQLFHIAVMIAAWIHFAGLLEAYHIIRSERYTCFDSIIKLP